MFLYILYEFNVGRIAGMPPKGRTAARILYNDRIESKDVYVLGRSGAAYASCERRHQRPAGQKHRHSVEFYARGFYNHVDVVRQGLYLVH